MPQNRYTSPFTHCHRMPADKSEAKLVKGACVIASFTSSTPLVLHLLTIQRPQSGGELQRGVRKARYGLRARLVQQGQQLRGTQGQLSMQQLHRQLWRRPTRVRVALGAKRIQPRENHTRFLSLGCIPTHFVLRGDAWSRAPTASSPAAAATLRHSDSALAHLC